MRRPKLFLALLLIAVTWVPSTARGQRPSVRSATPADVRLVPGGAGVSVAVSGVDLHYFDSASITVGGRNVADTRATLDTRADSRTRHVDVVAGGAAGAVAGATVSLHSSRLRTSLVVPVRIEVAGPPQPPTPQPPTAVASAPGTVSPGDPVVLDGSQSSDPDGQVIEWTWTLVSTSGGGGGSLQVNQPMQTDEPKFDLGLTGTKLAPGVHQFQLEVTDDTGLRSQPVKFELTVLGS